MMTSTAFCRSCVTACLLMSASILAAGLAPSVPNPALSLAFAAAPYSSSGVASFATPAIAAAAEACANEPLPTQGRVYYACDCGPGAARDCVPGADENEGTNTIKPWRSYRRAQSAFVKLGAGDTLAFCKGGAFSGDTEAWVNPNCRAATPCSVRDYSPPWAKGTLAAPRLLGVSLSLSNAGRARHEEGYRFLNLELDGTGKGDGVFVYNDIKDVFLCNLTIDGFAVGVNVEGSNPPEAGSDGRNARIELRGSRILNNTGMGWLGSCDDCVVDRNFFDHNGDANALDHSIYLGGARDSSAQLYAATGVRVTRNELRHSARGKVGVCMGAPLVAHGRLDRLLIEGNDIIEDLDAAGGGCWGIAVVASYAEAESFTNVTIRGNRVVNPGNTAIEVTSCSDCVVENNLIVQGQSAFGTRGIVAGVRTQDRQPGDLPLNAITIRNNTLYFSADVASESTGITLGAEGTKHVVVSNAILSSAAGNWSCFDLGLVPSAYQADRNLCWNRHGSSTWDRGKGTLRVVQAAGLDLHSLARDPKFKKVRLGDYDFSPGPGSPLIGAGDSTLGSPIDFNGLRRQTPPDIGAFQGLQN
jgi:hypothetical protein